MAEGRPETLEGGHAIVLCAQLGQGSPSWYAGLFNQSSNDTRRFLLTQHPEKLKLDESVPGLEDMLGDSRDEVRRMGAGPVARSWRAPE